MDSETTVSTECRTLCLAMLARQLQLAQLDALVAGVAEWVANKREPLGDVLVRRRCISRDARQMLELLVDAHLAQDSQTHPLAAFADDPEAQEARIALHKIADSTLRACLAEAGFASNSAAATPATQECQITHRYQLAGVHARGGLGQVSLALDEQLGRPVAVKEIQARFAHDATNRERFVREAAITAGLEHPGIVPVYGLGRHSDGRPFYAMRFVHGESLAQAIEQFHAARSADRGSFDGLSLRQLLRRFIDVCNTVAYAHSRGVLHRDLKPGNIMLGQYGETLIIDWGLAKAWRDPENSSQISSTADTLPDLSPNFSSAETPPLTQAGSAVGTAGYMSPEQMSGPSAITPASDLYSLGATLYHLLTGRPPHQRQEGEQRADLEQRVLKGDFPRPRALQRQVPRALESICLTALARQPESRYATPTELAAEVERWLADEPVQKHRERPAELWQRWTRKHRAWVRVGMVSLVLIALLAIGSAILLTRSNAATSEERQRRDMFTAWNLLEQGSAACMAGDVTKGLFLFLRSLALAEEVEGKYINAGKNPADAAQEFMTLPNSPPLSQAIRRQIAAWRPHLLEAGNPMEHDSKVTAIAICPSSQQSLFVTGTADGWVYIWDPVTGQRQHRFHAHSQEVRALAVSADGRYLLTAVGQFGLEDVTLWKWEKPTVAVLRPDFPEPPQRMSFAVDGSHGLFEFGNSATSSYAVWSLKELRHVATDRPTEIEKQFPNQLPPGWQPRRSPELQPGQASPESLRMAAIPGAALYSPGNRWLLDRSFDLEVQLRDAAFDVPASPPMRHLCPIHAAAFSQDEQFVMTGSYDGTAKIWRVPSGRLVGHPLPHDTGVEHVAFSHDGRLAVIAGGNIARAWKLESATNQSRSIPPTRQGPHWSRRADLVVEVLNDRILVRLRRTGSLIVPPLICDSRVTSRSLSPDGGQLFAGTARGTVYCWDLTNGNPKPLGGVMQRPGNVERVRWSAVGPVAVFGSETDKLYVWNLSRPDDLPITIPTGGPLEWTISSDGNFVAHSILHTKRWEPQHRAQITNLRTGEPTITEYPLSGFPFVFEFTPSGKQLAIAIPHEPKTIVLDCSTGKLLAEVTGGVEWDRRGWVSPDGEYVLVNQAQGLVPYHWPTRQAAASPIKHFGTEYELSFAFTAQGQLLTGSDDQTVRLWRLATAQPMTPRLEINGAVLGVDVSHDGRLGVAEVNFQHMVSMSAARHAVPLGEDRTFEAGVQLLDLSVRLPLGKVLLRADLAGTNPAATAVRWQMPPIVPQKQQDQPVSGKDGRIPIRFNAARGENGIDLGSSDPGAPRSNAEQGKRDRPRMYEPEETIRDDDPNFRKKLVATQIEGPVASPGSNFSSYEVDEFGTGNAGPTEGDSLNLDFANTNSKANVTLLNGVVFWIRDLPRPNGDGTSHPSSSRHSLSGQQLFVHQLEGATAQPRAPGGFENPARSSSVRQTDGGIFNPNSDPTENIPANEINDIMELDFESTADKEGWTIRIPQPDARPVSELRAWLMRATSQIDDPRDGPRLMTKAERLAVDGPAADESH